jgi:hypothetical protein
LGTTRIESIVWLGFLKKADHKRRGYLFQNRYKSIVLQKNSYLKELVGKRTCGFQGGRLILSCVTKSVSSGKKPDMRDYVNQVRNECPPWLVS